MVTKAALYAMHLRRNDPDELKRMTATLALKRWKGHLRAAKAGDGFYKEDHCEAMIGLHQSRLKSLETSK